MSYRTLLDWARTQIGIHNDPDGSNKYNEWYWGYRSTAAWCAVFVTYGFKEVGILDRLNGLTNKAGCEPWRRWAVSKGIFGKTPKVGSIVLYDWNPSAGDGADHIGIVDQIVSGGIMAIEGNTSANGSQTNGGYVMRKFRESWRVMGYVYVDTEARPDPCVKFERVAGKTRFETSEATAKRKDAAVVVSGMSYADALSAAYFARQNNGSILLTSEAHRDKTAAILKDFGKVYTIGGEVPEFDGAERIEGADRYETNLAALERCETPNKQIIIASGENFPDGLCAGMIDRPLMLVGRVLRAEQFDLLKARGLDRFYVFGGGIRSGVINDLKRLGEVSEFYGANRYATARVIASRFFPNAETVVLASGTTFADGISAANLGGYPLLLTDHGHTEEARTFIRTLNLKRAIVVGGTGALSDDDANWTLTK